MCEEAGLDKAVLLAANESLRGGGACAIIYAGARGREEFFF